MNKKYIYLIAIIFGIFLIIFIGKEQFRGKTETKESDGADIVYIGTANSPFSLEAAGKRVLNYDGIRFQGDMGKQNHEISDTQIYLSIPYSESFIFTPHADKCEFSLEAKRFRQSIFCQQKVEYAAFSKEEGITLHGKRMEFQAGLNIPVLPSHVLVRLFGVGQEMVRIQPTNQGMELQGVYGDTSLMFLTDNEDIYVVLPNLEGDIYQIDFTQLEEGIIILTDADDRSLEIKTQ